LWYYNKLPRVNKEVYWEILLARMNLSLVAEHAIYRFPQFDNVQDSIMKDMSQCLVEAMDEVFDYPEDWEQRKQYSKQE